MARSLLNAMSKCGDRTPCLPYNIVSIVAYRGFKRFYSIYSDVCTAQWYYSYTSFLGLSESIRIESEFKKRVYRRFSF